MLNKFKIDQSLSRQNQLDALRQVSDQDLVAALSSLRLTSFRAVTDQDFIHGDMIDLLRDGTVAKGFKNRGMRVIIGETETEACYLYYPRGERIITNISTATHVRSRKSTRLNGYDAASFRELLPG